MFGGNYSRKTFWIVTLITLFVGGYILVFASIATEVGGSETYEVVATLIISFILINTLANRIRDYGSNPWLALWSLIPLVGMIQAIYYGIRYKKPKEFQGSTTNERSQSTSQDKPVDEPELKHYSYHQEDEKETRDESVPKQTKPLKRFT